MRYAVIIEKTEGNYSAYVPDLPGCVAKSSTVDKVEIEIRETIIFHIDGLREVGLVYLWAQVKLSTLWWLYN